MTIVEFIEARIAEDEAVVGLPYPGESDQDCEPNGIGWADVGAISDVLMISIARVRAECAAKRQVIALKAKDSDPYTPGRFTTDAILYALALPYADRPDYDPAWRIA